MEFWIGIGNPFLRPSRSSWDICKMQTINTKKKPSKFTHKIKICCWLNRQYKTSEVKPRLWMDGDGGSALRWFWMGVCRGFEMEIWRKIEISFKLVVKKGFWTELESNRYKVYSLVQNLQEICSKSLKNSFKSPKLSSRKTWPYVWS